MSKQGVGGRVKVGLWLPLERVARYLESAAQGRLVVSLAA